VVKSKRHPESLTADSDLTFGPIQATINAADVAY
jgi:hypothetical protein